VIGLPKEKPFSVSLFDCSDNADVKSVAGETLAAGSIVRTRCVDRDRLLPLCRLRHALIGQILYQAVPSLSDRQPGDTGCRFCV